MRLAFVFIALSACDAGVPPPPKPKPKPVVAVKPDAPPVDHSVRPPTKADLVDYLEAIPGTGDVVAAIETSEGTLHCELFPSVAPLSVASFIGLATGKKAWTNPTTGNIEIDKPFYDGLTFHRVIPEFMIQGGDPAGRGTGGPGYTFTDEPGAAYVVGSLAMANAGPGTNGSQFFVAERVTDGVAGHFTVFGHCAEPDVVKRIARVPRDAFDKPTTPVTITKVSFSKIRRD